MLKRFVVTAVLLLATQAHADDQTFKLCKKLLMCGIDFVFYSAVAVGTCPPSPTLNLDFITGSGKVLIMIRDHIPDCVDHSSLPVTRMMLNDCQKGVASIKNLVNVCARRFPY